LLNFDLKILTTKIIFSRLTNLETRSSSTYTPYNCQNRKDLVPSSLEDMTDRLRLQNESVLLLIESNYLIPMGFTQFSASLTSNCSDQTLMIAKWIWNVYKKIQKNLKSSKSLNNGA